MSPKPLATEEQKREEPSCLAHQSGREAQVPTSLKRSTGPTRSSKPNLL